MAVKFCCNSSNMNYTLEIFPEDDYEKEAPTYSIFMPFCDWQVYQIC